MTEQSSGNLDLAIIGGGPAALAAAIYAARAGLAVKVYEKGEFGGLLPTIPLIENYPGFSGAGADLAVNMRKQAVQAGATCVYGECSALRKLSNSNFQLTIDSEPISARTVLVATGSGPRPLGFTPDNPVSYCALCDGPLAKGENVAVIGGANSALQESLYLANLAEHVTIITHSQIKADQELQNRVRQVSNIEIIEQVEPNAQLLRPYDYIFVYIGKLPATGFLKELANDYTVLSRDGYVITDFDNPHFPHQSVCPGLFAAGDVRQGSTKQVVTAAADGAMAALEIYQYLQKTG